MDDEEQYLLVIIFSSTIYGSLCDLKIPLESPLPFENPLFLHLKSFLGDLNINDNIKQSDLTLQHCSMKEHKICFLSMKFIHSSSFLLYLYCFNNDKIYVEQYAVYVHWKSINHFASLYLVNFSFPSKNCFLNALCILFHTKDVNCEIIIFYSMS